jgi:hypothetical protein
MSADPMFLAQLARAKSRLDDWRLLPSIQPDTDPEKIADICISRQRIAAELGELYEAMATSIEARSGDLAAISRAVAVMRETTLIDLHLIHARSSLNRVVMDAMGHSDSTFTHSNIMPRATA